jgi:hypothetical protein
VLVPRLVIFFPVVGSGSAVRVRRELVEFGGSLVRIVWHAGLPSISCTLRRSFHFAVFCRANGRNCQ